jgi:tetraacyldisaccharide 4'-kinase
LLDFLYSGVARWRRRAMERRPEARRRLERPVISIGNLSVGGTGKTPVVAAVARWLVERGERPAILSRGYKRLEPLPGVVVVSDGLAVHATLARAGDEPLMLAREVPEAVVCVAEDRYLAGVLAERRLGATLHVLDDGFQHLALARDLDVLVTIAGEIPNGQVLPRGRLREPADAAARAHVLVVMDATAGAASAEAWTLGISEACGARRVIGEPRSVGRLEPGAGNRIAEETPRVLLVAGIANPQRFAADVRTAGWTVVGEQWFPDHHAFTAGDVARISTKIAEVGADAVFTTGKDAVRFEALGSTPFPLYTVPLTVEFDPPTVLFDRIATVLSARSAHRGPPAAEACGAPAAGSPAAPTEDRRSPAGGFR